MHGNECKQEKTTGQKGTNKVPTLSWNIKQNIVWFWYNWFTNRLKIQAVIITTL